MGTDEDSGGPRTTLRADVCVVGAGPAGLTVAHELGQAGLTVLLLEAGPAAPPESGVDVGSTRSVGLPYAPEATRSAGVGGSSMRWSVETPLGGGYVRLRELDASDFEARPFVTASAWPFGRAELDPWYRRARELMGMEPGPDETPAQAPAHEPGAGTDLRGGLERRTYSFVHRSVFTHELPRRVRAHPRTVLVTDCTVTEVVTDGPGGQVERLRAVSRAHGRLSVEAGAYVLAGGALENARLLLASRSGSPAGIGNRYDHVGRHFMEHPHYVSGVVLPDGRRDGLAAEAWDVVLAAGFPRQTKYVLPAGLRRREGLLATVYKVKADRRTGLPGFGHGGDVPQETVDALLAARAALRQRDPRLLGPADGGRLLRASPELLRHALRRAGGRSGQGDVAHHVRVMGEQEPSPHSRLSLTGSRDELGVPTAELDWRLTDLDVRSMVRSQQVAAEHLGRAVGGRVVTTLGPDGVPRPQGGAHHMGTTRMSVRPEDGVVDPGCRVHGVRNLYVAGSSVFPTAGAANPTSTIVALALRLSARLVADLAAPRS